MTSNVQLNIADLDDEGGNMWDHARREYLAGVKATIICQRYGMSLSSFRMHARAGGWRRVDQPTCEVPPEFGEYHPEDRVDFADLATQAFLNMRRAIGSGRAAEASTWIKVYDRLADRARAGVMAELPDIPPPLPPPPREPLRLTGPDGARINELNILCESPDSVSQELDSLDSVPSESNRAP